MSLHTPEEPHGDKAEGSLELMIEPKAKDLGGFSVRRVLPAPERRMVGPFIFFDHMGPAEFPPGEGIQVRPHPHIGLATVTYLFEGEIMHRDSLGFVQPIRRGAVNLMTAGRGIVHSERSGDDLSVTSRLHGIQSWMALPDDQEDCEPDFVHYPATDLPEAAQDGVVTRIIIGEAFGCRSPVAVRSRMLYLESELRSGASLTLPENYEERAIYVVDGAVTADGRTVGPGLMAVAGAGKPVTVRALQNARVMIIGGDAMSRRHIWWNFVASSKDRIEKAKSDWQDGKFDQVPGETEFIPLP